MKIIFIFFMFRDVPECSMFLVLTTPQFFVFILLSLQFIQYPFLYTLLLSIALSPHLFSYFLISGYLIETSDNSNFFRFP